MLRLPFDQDFDHDILRALLVRLPDIDFTTAYLQNLSRVSDKHLLLWAAREGRVLVAHDENTIPAHFWSLLEKGEVLNGTLVVPRRMPIRQVIDELTIIIACSEIEEWKNIPKIFPL